MCQKQNIAHLDEDLALATRTMKAAPEEARAAWKNLIDRLLDRRLELMRRAKAQAPQPTSPQ